jgi:hypothetical protein
MRFWKVLPVEDAADVDGAMTAFAPDSHGAALAHFKYLCERQGPIEELDLMVWPEAGGKARTYRVRSAPVLTFSAEEMEAQHA